MIDANLKFKTVFLDKTKPRTMKLFLLRISQKKNSIYFQSNGHWLETKMSWFRKKIESIKWYYFWSIQIRLLFWHDSCIFNLYLSNLRLLCFPYQKKAITLKDVGFCFKLGIPSVFYVKDTGNSWLHISRKSSSQSFTI